MAEKTTILLDTEKGIRHAATSTPDGFAWRTLTGGVREGVDTVEVNNGKLKFTVVPTRGMGLWKAWLGDSRDRLELAGQGPGASRRSCR